MRRKVRDILDTSFKILSAICLLFTAVLVLVFLTPIFIKGSSALLFNATVFHREFLLDKFDRGSVKAYDEAKEKSAEAANGLYSILNKYENLDPQYQKALDEKINNSFDAIFKNVDLKNIKSEDFKPIINILEDSFELSKKEGGVFGLRVFFNDLAKSFEKKIRDEISSYTKTHKLSVIEKAKLRRVILTPLKEELASLDYRIAQSISPYLHLKKGFKSLLGPIDENAKNNENLDRFRYGQTRMDQAKVVLEKDINNIFVLIENQEGVKEQVLVSSKEYFNGTLVENAIDYVNVNLNNLMQPYFTFYWGFWTDEPYDSNILGGIYPMILGTIYLTFLAILIASPLGIVAGIYFSEYASNSKMFSLLETFVSTLAGVPSIVFGLFGLSFLINVVGVSEGKSVFAGGLTLALLILPTIIKASKEAIKTVPVSYKEASLGLGASKFKTIFGVILPASLPSVLTGIIISMGRAAGETAPIIFTAATSTGAAVAIWEIFNKPTTALSWNIYNICSEHEMADRLPHVQYAMAMTLVLIVLLLNVAAIVLRAKFEKKLRG